MKNNKYILFALPLLAGSLLMTGCVSPFLSFGSGSYDPASASNDTSTQDMINQNSFDATQNMINNDAAVNASQAAATAAVNQ